MNACKRTARKRHFLLSGLPVDTDERFRQWKREQRLLASNAVAGCADDCIDHNEPFPVARVVTATAIAAIIIALAAGILSHC